MLGGVAVAVSEVILTYASGCECIGVRYDVRQHMQGT
jgi:hypothetical protein